MRKGCGALAALVIVLMATGATRAQERFGGLTGVVMDESGGVLPAATITVTSKTTGALRVVVTGGDGVYLIPDLDPGRYALKVEMMGFSTVELEDVNVLLGKTLKIDTRLQIGAMTEVVTVQAEATPVIDLRSTVVAHNVTAEEFDRMPKARTFQSIAMTAPSVNAGLIEGGFQVNGASGAENAFTIDGVVTNSLINGVSRQDTVFEYLQEVQVKTTGISAEYGGALGGVVSAVTKSGGNTVRGEAHYFYDGSALSAAPVERLVLDPADDQTVTYVQDGEQPNHRHEVGGSIGGPILRDRLFYFGSYSPRVARRTTAYLFSNGTEPGEIAQDQVYHQAFGKVTYAGGRVTASGSVLYTPTTSTGFLPAYNGTRANVLSSSAAGNAVNIDRGFEQNQVTTTGNVDITLSNSSFLSLRAGHFHDRYNDTGIPDTTSYTYQTSSVGILGVPAALQGPIGTQNTPRAQITNYDVTKRSFFNADYNHVFTAAGTHAFKGGFGVQHTVNDVDFAFPGGFVYLYWDRSFTSSATGETGRGTYGYYEVNDRGTGGRAGANILSLYAQDQWTIGNRLTLNLGVRLENEKIPSFRPDLLANAIEFGFGDKIAPRLGATYVLADGRMKLFGSWGRYYDWTKYELSRGSYGGDFWRIYYRALDTLDLGNLDLDNMPGADLWNPAVSGSFRDRRVPNFDSTDPNIKPMYQDSTSVGLEYQLRQDLVLTAHYVHNSLSRTIEDIGALQNGDEIYVIGNPGEGLSTIQAPSGATPEGFAVPRPKRQYDAVQLGLARRFRNNYFFSANYTWSRLYGNYAGISSSDELRTPTTGTSSAIAQQQGGSIFRPGGNANRAYDIDELLWNAHGNLDVVGRLATDRPHVLKLYGAYTFPFGTQVGANFYAGSGTPISTYVVTLNQTQVFVEGRGDMGRTPTLTQTDLLVSHELPFGGSKRLRLELTLLNLFNQKTARHVFNFLNRGAGTPRPSSSIDLSDVNLSEGYDYDALIQARPDGADAYDPRYGMADLFNTGLQGYFTVKFLF